MEKFIDFQDWMDLLALALAVLNGIGARAGIKAGTFMMTSDSTACNIYRGDFPSIVFGVLQTVMYFSLYKIVRLQMPNACSKPKQDECTKKVWNTYLYLYIGLLLFGIFVVYTGIDKQCIARAK